MRNSSLTVTAFLVILIINISLISHFIGCAKKGELIVANVGGEKITWGEFKEGYLKSPQFRKAHDDSSAKHEYLNTLIQKKLMTKEAYRQGLDKVESIKEQVGMTENSLIVRELWEREIVDKTISESEIKDFYDHSAKEVKARHILIKAPPNASPQARQEAKAKADSLLALVKEGEDFAMLAEKNSEDPGSASKGGDLGFFGWGKMVNEFQEVAFALQPDQVSDVIETQYGYHIIKVEEQREAQRQSYEEMKTQIRNQLQRSKESELRRNGEEYIENLKLENSLSFDEEALTLLSEKKKTGEATNEMLTDAEQSTVLVSYKSGTMTLSEFVEWEKTISAKARAKATDPKSLKRQLEGKLVNEFLVAKAKSLGLDKKEEIATRVRSRREDLMVQELNKSVESAVQITEEDIRSYFEEHKEEYVIPDQANIREIQVKEKTLAENLLKRMKKGADIASLAEEYSERKWAAKKGGEFGFFTENEYGPIGKEAFKLNVGEFGGPLKVQGGYSVFKVIDRNESRAQTFEEAKPIIQRKLETERKKAAFENLMTSLKEKASIDINMNVLIRSVTEEQSTPEEKKG